MAEEPPRTIHALYAENFKRLKLVNLIFGPAPGLELITGANGQGKTSLLDSAAALFGGANEIDPVPIRDGETEAVIEADLGDLRITRTFKMGEDGKVTTKVTGRSVDGRMKFDSPQKMLSSLLGKLTLDPLSFLDMKPPEKFKALQRFVPGYDFELSKRQYDSIFAARTDVNRDTTNLTKAANTIAVPPDTPRQRVSIDRLSRELEQAGVKNTARETAIAALATKKSDSERFIAAIAEMQRQVAELNERIKKGMDTVVGIQAEIEAWPLIPAEIDTSKLRRDLAEAAQVNRNVDLLIRRREQESLAEASQKKADDLTAELEAIKRDEREAIEAAKMPLPGLSLANGEVTLQGVPFEQASHAEQLRAAVAIAAAENPALRLILVREGSLMDSKSLKLMADMAVEMDLKVLVEKVDETGEVGFVIEDGLLVSSPESRDSGKPLAQPVPSVKGKRR